jgi:DNA-3-methyladenine glycosylase II
VLAARDPVMARLIEATGPCSIGEARADGGFDHFGALCRSILFQQLAGKAAATIHGRFLDLLDGVATPEALLALPEGALRGAGLSGNKAASVTDLAERVLAGQVDLDHTATLDDEALIEQLSAVRGIGRWTAEMFLMFQLARLDVWPVGDLGVRKGFGLAWGLPGMPTPKELLPLGDPFRPYRSVVAWYCWRAAETITPA